MNKKISKSKLNSKGITYPNYKTKSEKTLQHWTSSKFKGSGLKGKGTRKSGQTRI